MAEPAFGYFDEIRMGSRTVRFMGWLLSAIAPFEEVRIVVDGEDVGPAKIYERPDLAVALPRIPHASRAGIHARIPLERFPRGKWTRLDLVGRHTDGRTSSISLDWRPDFARLYPDPPAALMSRVAASSATSTFRLHGLRLVTELRAALARHAPPWGITRVLDWGCGCGRVIAYLPHFEPDWEIHGCDVDREGVEWCAQHLGVQTRKIEPDPPTDYAPETFDAIFASSIFTHLARERHRPWLRELGRLLRPGGVLIATTHGRPAAEFFDYGEGLRLLESEGVSDAQVDPRLDEVLTPGSYRTVFQSEEWTRREWGAELDVVEYTPCGANGYQDLVVLRRSERSSS